MRALFLNHNVVHTGTFHRSSCFARELVRAGNDVTLVTTSADLRAGGREWEWHGVKVVEAPDLFAGSARTGWDPWNTVWRVRRLATERFELIHAFDSRPAVILPALALHKRTGVPLFMDWADWWGRGGVIGERSGRVVRTFFGPLETWFEEAFRSGATANTTIVESLRQRCIRLGVDPARVLTLPNGCVPPSPNPPAQSVARRQLGLSGEPLLLHVGVALPADATFLFDAFRSVRRVQPSVRLALVGRFRFRVPAEFEAAVIRRGFISDAELELWLAAADAGLLVLRDTIASRGRWPGKLSDYLTGGVPIVMPRVGAAAELIGGAGAAALCEPTADRFAEAVVAVLRDGDLRAGLAAHARRLAGGELAWPRIAARLLDFYDRFGVRTGLRTERRECDSTGNGSRVASKKIPFLQPAPRRSAFEPSDDISPDR
jgi:glycosyltransferase involved in cell wall biosynthesis